MNTPVHPFSFAQNILAGIISFSVLLSATLRAQTDLLPDLYAPVGVQYVVGLPGDRDTIATFGYGTTTLISPGRTHLRWTFGTANIGSGPLEIRRMGGSDPDTSFAAYQRIMRTDSSWWERPLGRLKFNAQFTIFQINDWAVYRLRTLESGNGVGPTIMQTANAESCMLDLFPFDVSLPSAPSAFVYQSCGPLVQGLSVGWITIHDQYFAGQNMDVTDVPNGYYWLEGEADPENIILESDETNNVSRKRILLCHNPATIPPHDSLWLSESSGAPGGSVMVQASVANLLTLTSVLIPFSWSGPLVLELDSVSTGGLRSASAMDPVIVAVDPFNHSISVELSAPDSALPGLSPGSGPILNLFFTMSEESPLQALNNLILTSVGGSAPRFRSACASFTPGILQNGSVLNSSCCDVPGDANNDGSIDMGDIMFSIARIFMDGPSPDCHDKADANSDSNLNISDITFMISRLFAGGVAPVCGKTGA